ncbi:hypothetical protein PT974_01350 [Cladobotryum mycophilum]|uniref:Uncharacterized protein n=1 Tax=Cladobotryum mycophilum TaxID=491253 RepID=A0ABR0T3F5_9HYPO
MPFMFGNGMFASGVPWLHRRPGFRGGLTDASDRCSAEFKGESSGHDFHADSWLPEWENEGGDNSIEVEHLSHFVVRTSQSVMNVCFFKRGGNSRPQGMFRRVFVEDEKCLCQENKEIARGSTRLHHFGRSHNLW